MKSIFIVCLTLVAAGCGSSSPVADDACMKAAAHLAACGTPVAMPPSCDADAAGALVQTSCADLTAATQDLKADGGWFSFNSVACAAGMVRYCPQPACTAPKYPSVSDHCADYIAIDGCGGCQYYACREAQAAQACGPDGYYLGYALKYCERFLSSLRPRMSPAGQRFLDGARNCLMDFVESELPYDLTCSDVKSRALASHVACYHDYGFCELPVRDQYLLINTVDPAQLDLAAGLRTATSCL